MTKIVCEGVGCGLTIIYDNKGHAEVTPGESVRVSGLQMAIFQRDASRLPKACQECGDKCGGRQALTALGPKKK